jgi:hypothetical protein
MVNKTISANPIDDGIQGQSQNPAAGFSFDDEAKLKAEKAMAQLDFTDPAQAQLLYAAAAAAAQQQSTTGTANAGMFGQDSPLYVNAKQYKRILHRRQARAAFQAKLARQGGGASSSGASSSIRDSPMSVGSNGGKKPYMHESRHRHAMRRPRGPGGRFLTAKEMADLKSRGSDESGNNTSSGQQGFAEQSAAQ